VKAEPRGWAEAYLQVMRESDPIKLMDLVLEAEEAISLRCQEIKQSPEHFGERRVMDAAAADLLAIRTHKFGSRMPA
jgi:hypothetical protein